jgi:cysteine desulfurase
MQKIENYYDYAAATPMLKEAKEAMEPFFSENFYNPSALYLSAKSVKQALNNARQAVAFKLGAKAPEIIFTAGGTEANNLAIQGVMRLYEGSNLVTTGIEHDSILKTVENFDFKVTNVDKFGTAEITDLVNKIDDKTILVSVGYSNNEIGTIQPLAKISAEIANIRQDRKKRGVELPIYLHTDACQAVNYLDLQVSKLGVDLMTINSGKIYGPKQCGALFVKSGVKISPLIFGGGQEKSLRSGTENVANICGFATALQAVRSDYKEESNRLTALRDDFIKKVINTGPNFRINGPISKNRIANSIHLLVKGVDNEWLTMSLDEQGFMVANGSACSASSDEPSHVLKAIGMTDKDARSCIRITLGRHTNQQNLNLLLESIIKTVAKN